MKSRQTILAMRSTGQFANCAWAAVASFHACQKYFKNQELTMFLSERDDLDSILHFKDGIKIFRANGLVRQLLEHGPRRELLRNFIFSRELDIDGFPLNFFDAGFAQITPLNTWQFAGHTARQKISINADDFFDNKHHRKGRVVLHVRRSDYKTWRRGLFYWRLEELLDGFSHLKVDTVVSDDENVRLEARQLGYITGDGSLQDDYRLMLEAETICGPPSSLNMLAAWQSKADLHWLMRDGVLTALPVDLGKVTGFYCFSKGVLKENEEANQLYLCGKSDNPYLKSFYV